MYEGYAKLFSSIITSTIWQESIETKIVWITMLALKDKDGFVSGSIPGLAHIAGVSIEKCEEAINKFKLPDSYSRSKEFDGRRIEDIDGGWLILNADKYRDKRDPEKRKEQNREAQDRFRNKDKVSHGKPIVSNSKQESVNSKPIVSQNKPISAHTDTYTVKEINKEKDDLLTEPHTVNEKSTSKPQREQFEHASIEVLKENVRKSMEQPERVFRSPY